ncbi:MAG: dTMP kinase [Pseudohongiellaceae bacterium]|nr:dTMP kinase [Pseudohongiellaceae bacterium]
MFIVFEGIDGCGKSSVISALNERLGALSHEVIVTSELSRKDKWSQEARAKLMNAQSAQEELNIIIPNRLVHEARVLCPALQKDSLVLMDRYLMSTIAYQGGEHISQSQIIASHDAYNLPVPDLVIYLDISLDTSLKRRQHRTEQNSIDTRDERFFRGCLINYWSSMECLRKQGWRIECLNAELPLASVIDAAELQIRNLIKEASPLAIDSVGGV